MKYQILRFGLLLTIVLSSQIVSAHAFFEVNVAQPSVNIITITRADQSFNINHEYLVVDNLSENNSIYVDFVISGHEDSDGLQHFGSIFFAINNVIQEFNPLRMSKLGYELLVPGTVFLLSVIYILNSTIVSDQVLVTNYMPEVSHHQIKSDANQLYASIGGTYTLIHDIQSNSILLPGCSVSIDQSMSTDQDAGCLAISFNDIIYLTELQVSNHSIQSHRSLYSSVYPQSNYTRYHVFDVSSNLHALSISDLVLDHKEPVENNYEAVLVKTKQFSLVFIVILLLVPIIRRNFK